jgi:hypothetical protein
MNQVDGTVHAFRLLRTSTTKATDHALQKYDNFTRYGHLRAEGSMTSPKAPGNPSVVAPK